MTVSDYQFDSDTASHWKPMGMSSQWASITCAFSLRQQDVLRELAKVQTNKRIGKALMLSPETVKHHLKTIFAKLGVSRREDAIAEARRRAVIP